MTYRYTSLVSVVAFLGTLLLPGKAFAATSTVSPMVFSESQRSVNVNADQYFMIALSSNRTTGYSWSYSRFSRPGVVQMLGGAYSKPNSASAGAGGTATLLFKALAAGTTRLTLGYRRPWETKPAQRTVSVDITVAGASTDNPTLPCVRTRVASIGMPVGPAEYQSGRMTLANGVALRISGAPAPPMVREFRTGDQVVACYGMQRTWADAPRSRSTTVLDLRSGSFFGALIGEWPQSSLVRP